MAYRRPALDWWELAKGEYTPLAEDAVGRIRSRIFSGLILTVPALLVGDLRKALAALSEHSS